TTAASAGATPLAAAATACWTVDIAGNGTCAGMAATAGGGGSRGLTTETKARAASSSNGMDTVASVASTAAGTTSGSPSASATEVGAPDARRISASASLVTKPR